MTSTNIPLNDQTSRVALSHSQHTRSLEVAQAALLARYAPDTLARRVRWSQGETQVLELGSGPALLLVHGGLASGFYWAPILGALAENRRVLVVDLPGHGLADSFDYTDVNPLAHAPAFLGEILNALELPAVDIVANSLGGLWSVAFALSAPDRVSRLALVGATAGVTRAIPIQLRTLALPLVGQALGRRLMSNQGRESNRKFWGELLVVHPERLDDTLLDADIAHARRNLASMLSLVHCVANLRGLRNYLLLGNRWQELQTPTLSLCGERDVFMSPNARSTWEAIAVRNPNLHITRVPDAGHLPWLDDPERIVNETERFLTR